MGKAEQEALIGGSVAEAGLAPLFA
jgi:hypothetical protein